MNAFGSSLLTRWRNRVFARNPYGFLRHVRGVVHVGANRGQERDTYARHGVRVLWIEPVPEVFADLQRSIQGFANQRALQRLVTDREGAVYDFHVSNNNEESSSILGLHQHSDIWPGVRFERTLSLQSTTIDHLVQQKLIDLAAHDALVVDTQGAELMVLRGAESSLRAFRYVKLEAPDFEAYTGCCLVRDVEAHLQSRGFREVARCRFADRPGGGGYYELLFMGTRPT